LPEQVGDPGVPGEDSGGQGSDPAGGRGGDQVRDQLPPDPAALPGIFHQHAELSRAGALRTDQGGETDHVAGGLAGCQDTRSRVGKHRL
jgi:hypothetical protein